ncbi:MAG: alpha/beta hydrolase, partial [Ginsengibacter sp.]
MNKLSVSLLIAAVFSTLLSSSQDTLYFKKGLMITASAQYGREAIVTDELAYRLYTNRLKTPADGESFGVDEDGKDISWQPLVADSLNRLRPLTRLERGRGRFGGNYIYLTYYSSKKQAALLHINGNSFVFLNGNLHTGDPYSSGWLYIPVKLKKGLNEFYVRGYFQTTASLIFPKKPVFINTEDPTLPFIVLTHNNNLLHGAIVIINTSDKELKGLQIKSNIEGREMIAAIPSIPSLSSRKVRFDFNGEAISKKGTYHCNLTLFDNDIVLDEKIIPVEGVEPSDHYSETFTSDIDGSLQYYAVTPQTTLADNSALFLSVHGAGVEAIGQARAYHSKDWGTLV